MIIKEFNFLLKDTKSASEIKNSILPQLNLKASSENAGYIAKVYDTQSKKIYLLVSDNIKTEKNLSDNIFEISGNTTTSILQNSVTSGASLAESTTANETTAASENTNPVTFVIYSTFREKGSPASNDSVVASANNGDTYLDTATNEIYIKNNDTWQKINDTPDLSGDNAPTSTATLGQVYQDNLTGNTYVYSLVDGEAQWTKLINVVKDLNNVSAKSWSGEGSPKTSTNDMNGVKVGDFYHDTITNTHYIAVNINDNTITWAVMGEVEKIKAPKVESNAVFGEIGGLGAGVAYLPEIAASVGLTPMSGANDPSNENFGNFVDSSKNVFVCIPLMFYKADTKNRNTDFYNKPNIYISYVAQEGYAPFYAFKKSDGSYVPCVFVSKYIMGLKENRGTRNTTYTPISQKDKDCAVSASDENYMGIGKISNCQFENKYFFKAAKAMNSNTVLHYAALRFVYYMVAEAHMQAAAIKFGGISKVPSSICAYLDIEPYFPKGCNDNLSDINDKKIRYIQGFYSSEGRGRTGSCNNPAKTTFNGQKCGIVDMGGLMNEVDAGYICKTVGNSAHTFALKGIDLVKSLDETTFTDIENYIQLDLRDRRSSSNDSNSRWTSAVRVGYEEKAIFSFKYPDPEDGFSVSDYNCDNFLNPLSQGTSSDGTIAYGQDHNGALKEGYAPVFGGTARNRSSVGLLFFGGEWYEWSSSNALSSARTMIVPN